MTQSPEAQEINLQELIEFFQSEAQSKAPRTALSYLQAIKAFSRASALATSHSLHHLLSAFYIHLALSGYSHKTTILYSNIITSLLRKAKENGPANLQAACMAPDCGLNEVKTIPPQIWDNAFSEKDFDTLLTLSKSSASLSGEYLLAADLLLLSLLNSSLPLEKIASLRISDASSLSSESEEIVRRNIDPRRRNIFLLDQSRRTPRQLTDHVEKIIRALLSSRHLPSFGTPDQTIRSYWAYTALRAGISPAQIIATVGTPAGVPVLSLIAPAIIKNTNPDCGLNESNPDCGLNEVKTKESAANEVNTILLANPANWYAMRLRPHITFENLTERFTSLKEEHKLATPPLFYPTEEIARRTGKKIQFKTRPVLRDTVFFNTRATEILPMFAKIGDLAWCYKTDGAHGRTYAAIPTSSFRRFQQTIGQFTPDYEVAEIGTLPPLPGEKIEIIAGPFAGRQALFLNLDQADASPSRHNLQADGSPSRQNLQADGSPSRHNPDCGAHEVSTPTILYRCALLADNGIEWRITIPTAQTRRSQ